MFDRSVLIMTTTIFAGMQDSILVLKSSKVGWNVRESLVGTHPQSITFDRVNPNRAYCGTFGGGLWKTDDGGQNWYEIGKASLSTSNVTSVSVSPLERGYNGFNVIYVGTEPSESIDPMTEASLGKE
jgi:hypothetical protein